MKRWFLFVLKAGSILSTLGLLALVTYGHFSPWQVADDALTQFRGSPRLLVGIAYEFQSIDGHTTERRSQTYVVLPTALQTLSTVEVTKDERGVHVEDQPFGFLVIVLVFVFGLGGLWRFFVRRDTQKSHVSRAL